MLGASEETCDKLVVTRRRGGLGLINIRLRYIASIEYSEQFFFFFFAIVKKFVDKKKLVVESRGGGHDVTPPPPLDPRLETCQKCKCWGHRIQGGGARASNLELP